MAFQKATGWNNLPNGNFSPVIYSKKMQKQFRKSSVTSDITNTDYFGEISNFGDSVRIIKEPEITVSSYARGTKLVSQELDDSDFTLLIDRSNYFQFAVDDIEEKHSHVNFQSAATDRAAYKMKDKFDKDILGYISGYEYDEDAGTWSARTAAVGTKAESTADSDELLAAHKLREDDFLSGGSSTESVSVGTSGTYVATPLQVLNRMVRLLNQKNVDTDGRWVVVDPVFMEKLMDEDSKFMDRDYQDGEQLSNGMIMNSRARGFRLYMSNNLPVIGTGPATPDTDGSNANYGVIVAGHDSAAATAEQISKTESQRATDFFGDIVRGMHLYGRKILRPEALVQAWYNINA